MCDDPDEALDERPEPVPGAGGYEEWRREFEASGGGGGVAVSDTNHNNAAASMTDEFALLLDSGIGRRNQHAQAGNGRGGAGESRSEQSTGPRGGSAASGVADGGGGGRLVSIGSGAHDKNGDYKECGVGDGGGRSVGASETFASSITSGSVMTAGHTPMLSLRDKSSGVIARPPSRLLALAGGGSSGGSADVSTHELDGGSAMPSGGAVAAYNLPHVTPFFKRRGYLPLQTSPQTLCDTCHQLFSNIHKHRKRCRTAAIAAAASTTKQ